MNNIETISSKDALGKKIGCVTLTKHFFKKKGIADNRGKDLPFFLSEYKGLAVQYMNQVHGTSVQVINDCVYEPVENTDVLFTRSNRVSLAIMSADCLPIAIAIFLMGEKPDFSTITPFAWYGLFHIAFLTSIVAYSIWATALQFLKPSQVAVFINLQPPTTALVAMAVYKQIPQEGFWLALPIVLFGVWTVQRK